MQALIDTVPPQFIPVAAVVAGLAIGHGVWALVNIVVERFGPSPTKSLGMQYWFVLAVCAAWSLLALSAYPALLPWIALMLWGAMVIAAAFIDLRTFLLPDVITLTGAAVTVPLARYALGMGWMDIGVGMGLGAGLFLLLQRVYRFARQREGLGSGDVKFMLMLGGMCGGYGLPVLVMVAAFSGLFVSVAAMLVDRTRSVETMIPFGPFLALGALVELVWGDALLAMLR